MSYGFTITAATKGDAKEAVKAKLDEIVSAQPVHEADHAQILTNANAVIDLLADAKEGHEITVTMNGYVSGIWSDGKPTELTSAKIEAYASWYLKRD